MIDCGTLHVPVSIMQHVAHVESSFNPYAIGVVKGQLSRQPRNLTEAVAAAKMLEKAGYNFSLGIVQVNRYNLKKYGLHTYEKAFDVCSNLLAGSKILRECYISARNDWGKAFSCYYSGNFITGYRHGYVQKIFQSMRKTGNVSYVKLNNAAQNQIVAFRTAAMQKNTVSRYTQNQSSFSHTGDAYKAANNSSETEPTQKNTSSETIADKSPSKDSAFIF